MSVLGHGTSFTLKRPIQKRQINNSDQTETVQECVIMCDRVRATTSI